MKKELGFSLIELLISLLIIAILAGISMPFYKDYRFRAKRVEVRTALQGAAQRLHTLYFVNKGYTNFVSPKTNAAVTAQQWLEDYGLGKVPATGPANYEISIELTDAGTAPDPNDSNKTIPTPHQGYFLIAKAVGKQVKDKCKYFVLSSRGIKEAYNQDPSIPLKSFQDKNIKTNERG